MLECAVEIDEHDDGQEKLDDLEDAVGQEECAHGNHAADGLSSAAATIAAPYAGLRRWAPSREDIDRKSALVAS